MFRFNTVFLALCFGICFGAHAGPQKKSNLNTNLYEEEKSEKNFTAKVRVVREIQDEVEVFFDTNSNSKGPYSLPKSTDNYGALLKKLYSSQKAGGPAVTVSIDAQQRIKSVELSAESSTSTKKPWEE